MASAPSSRAGVAVQVLLLSATGLSLPFLTSGCGASEQPHNVPGAEAGAEEAGEDGDAAAVEPEAALSESSEGGEECTDLCALEGQAECDGSALRECATAENGCLAWRLVEDCAATGDSCSAPATGQAECVGAAAPKTNLENLRYHQQPLAGNDPGPFHSGGEREGWSTVASLYGLLHTFSHSLPWKLKRLDPAWTSWRGTGGLAASDPTFYQKDSTYPIEEFLQQRYLKTLAGSEGLDYAKLRTIAQGVATDLGWQLQIAEVPITEMRDRLLQGWFALANNTEWGGHYFAIVWYEAGADPSLPENRYYYILDPANSDSSNKSIQDNLQPKLTARFRKLLQNRQTCGSAQCSSDYLGLYVLTGKGINAVLKTDQLPNKAVLMFKKG